MFSVELYGRVRHACHVEGLSQREAARRFGIHRNTVRKMLAFSVPPGYWRTQPPLRPKLGTVTAIIDQILAADRAAPPKQRHTAKRIFERLRAEHGYAGGYTTVKDYVREHRAGAQEMFVPLAHPPGHAQADFGEAVAVIGGVRQKIHFFCLDLPHSDAGFLKAYPAERIEALLDESSVTPPPARIAANLPLIDRLFASDDYEEILDALEADGSDWARTELATLRAKSPQACKVSLRLLYDGARVQDFGHEMRQEYAVATRVVQRHDFVEGVRALLVDKDNKPRWEPPTPEAVTEHLIDTIFAPMPESEEWTPL